MIVTFGYKTVSLIGFNENLWLLFFFWITLYILQNFCNLKPKYYDFASDVIQIEGVIIFIIIDLISQSLIYVFYFGEISIEKNVFNFGKELILQSMEII